MKREVYGKAWNAKINSANFTLRACNTKINSANFATFRVFNRENLFREIFFLRKFLPLRYIDSIRNEEFTKISSM